MASREENSDPSVSQPPAPPAPTRLFQSLASAEEAYRRQVDHNANLDRLTSKVDTLTDTVNTLVEAISSLIAVRTVEGVAPPPNAPPDRSHRPQAASRAPSESPSNFDERRQYMDRDRSLEPGPQNDLEEP